MEKWFRHNPQSSKEWMLMYVYFPSYFGQSACSVKQVLQPHSSSEWVGISLKSVKTVAQSKTLNNVKFFTLYAIWLPLKPYLAAPAGCCTQAISTSIIFPETMAKWSTEWVHGQEASQAWGWGALHVLNWTWLLSGTKKDVQWGGGQSGKRMGALGDIYMVGRLGFD